MWVFLQFVSLFICAIAGNLEVNKSARLDHLQREYESLSPDKSDLALTEHDYPNSAKSRVNSNLVQDVGTNRKFLSKANGISPAYSWLYLSTRNKNLLQKRKTPPFNPWGGKRVGFNRPIPKTRGSNRVRFHNWGGKRGNGYLYSKIGPLSKKKKVVYDRESRRFFVDGYGDYADGKTFWWKIPFNSWGGKRSDKVLDERQKQFLLMMRNDTNENKEKDGFSDWKVVDSDIHDKNTIETRHNLDKELNILADLDYPFQERNNTFDDNVMNEDIGHDDWLMITPAKKGKREHLKKLNFNPWGGKRSSETYAFHLSGDYSRLPEETVKRRWKAFFPWGG